MKIKRKDIIDLCEKHGGKIEIEDYTTFLDVDESENVESIKCTLNTIETAEDVAEKIVRNEVSIPENFDKIEIIIDGEIDKSKFETINFSKYRNSKEYLISIDITELIDTNVPNMYDMPPYIRNAFYGAIEKTNKELWNNHIPNCRVRVLGDNLFAHCNAGAFNEKNIYALKRDLEDELAITIKTLKKNFFGVED